jgi:lysozyme
MRRKAIDNYSGPTTLGIDVSRWQGKIDWDKLPDSIRFAISRTGDGGSKDKYFVRNWQESARTGLVRGSYHYFRADRDGKYQAETVINLIDKAGGLTKNDLPPALDLEGGARKNLPGGVLGGTKDLPIDLVVEECLEFLQEITRVLKVLPIIYTGQAFHWWLSQKRPDLAEEFKIYPLWLPSYSASPLMPVNIKGEGFPWSHWMFWQYTAKGQISGIEGAVDLNLFRGTSTELIRFAKVMHIGDHQDGPWEDSRNSEKEMLLKEAKRITTRLLEIQTKLLDD